jgi:dCMP deaminase
LEVDMSVTDWDRRFLELAYHIAEWSKDPSSKVGCVVVGADKRDVCFGYNGFPPGITDDERLADRDTKYKLVRHAETNALSMARGRFKPETLYVTHPPCMKCTVEIVGERVKRVVSGIPSKPFAERWRSEMDDSEKMLSEVGIKLKFLSLEEMEPALG